MENKYWIGRKRAAMGMAREAVSADIRLIHYDLAGRYSIMAAKSAAPRSPYERAMLHLPDPAMLSAAAAASRQQGVLEAWGDPDKRPEPAGDGS